MSARGAPSRGGGGHAGRKTQSAQPIMPRIGRRIRETRGSWAVGQLTWGSGWVACGRPSGREKQTRQWVLASAPRLMEHMEWNTQVTQPISNVARPGCRGGHYLGDGHPGMTLPHLIPSPCRRRGVGLGAPHVRRGRVASGWSVWVVGVVARVAVFSWVCEARRVVLFVPVSCDAHVCALAEHIRVLCVSGRKHMLVSCGGSWCSTISLLWVAGATHALMARWISSVFTRGHFLMHAEWGVV